MSKLCVSNCRQLNQLTFVSISTTIATRSESRTSLAAEGASWPRLIYVIVEYQSFLQEIVATKTAHCKPEWLHRIQSLKKRSTRERASKPGDMSVCWWVLMNLEGSKLPWGFIWTGSRAVWRPNLWRRYLVWSCFVVPRFFHRVPKLERWRDPMRRAMACPDTD